MSPAGIFAMGVLVTLIFGAGLSPSCTGQSSMVAMRLSARPRRQGERGRHRGRSSRGDPADRTSSRPPGGRSGSNGLIHVIDRCRFRQPPESTERTVQMKRITSMLARCSSWPSRPRRSAHPPRPGRAQKATTTSSTRRSRRGSSRRSPRCSARRASSKRSRARARSRCSRRPTRRSPRSRRRRSTRLRPTPAKLKSVLLYHVVAGRALAADVVKLTSAKTLEGRSVAIKVVDGSVFLDGAKVTTPDVTTSNVIHVIDSVLLPKEAVAAKPKTIVQTATAAGTFKTLTSLLTKAASRARFRGRGRSRCSRRPTPPSPRCPRQP